MGVTLSEKQRQERPGVLWNLTSALSAVIGWWITSLVHMCLLSSAVIRTSSYLQWWHLRGCCFKQCPLWGGKQVFVDFLSGSEWWDAVVAVNSPSNVKSAAFNSFSKPHVGVWWLYRSVCTCMWSVTQWRGWFWTADVVCVIENPFQTTD